MFFVKFCNLLERNSNFLIPIYFQPNGVNLWHFKLRLINLTEFIVWNISGLDKMQGYGDYKIRVCDKDSISLTFFTCYS